MHVDGASVRGNEMQAALLASSFVARGHEVVASCRGGGPVERLLRESGARTTPVRPRGDADPVSALRFAAWLRAERPDAVLLTSWKRAFNAGWAARVSRVPRVLLRLGGVHPVSPGPGGWKYRHALTRWYHGIIVNSRAVGEHLLRVIPGLPESRVHLVPNGVRLPSAPAAPLRQELGISAGARLLVSVGGLEPHKGFDVLIRALAASGADAHLVVVGEGPHLSSLRSLAEASGLAGRVHFIGQRSDVSAVLAACDLFVLASRGEGMSVAMLEAAFARRPVISTAVGGTWELLAKHDGRDEGGWVVPVGDEPALARGIRQVLGALRDDPASVAARVEEARWRIDHWLTVEGMIDGYEAALAGR